MTALRFDDYGQLTSELAHRVASEVEGAEVGFSNVSCSAYAQAGDRKVRFSDHADHHGSDITFRIDHLIRNVFVEYDDDGNSVEVDEQTKGADFMGTEIDRADFERIVSEAAQALS